VTAGYPDEPRFAICRPARATTTGRKYTTPTLTRSWPSRSGTSGYSSGTSRASRSPTWAAGRTPRWYVGWPLLLL